MKKTSVASILFGLVLLVAALTPVAAFPGIQSYLKDESGQYVYYRDYTFPYEAYVGFLHYDEGTYGMRFYAPNQPLEGVSQAAAQAGMAAKGGMVGVPKSVEILFTVNTETKVTEMTGEKFLTTITGSDTEIVNYLHDLVYEFSARRRKLADPVVTKAVSSREDFPQFGGPVTMKYSFDVPIFNLQEIIGADGAPSFQLATVLAQRPKLKDYIPQMCEKLAEALRIPLGRVNIKATTEEGLGFTGSGEGIACHAVCLLEETNNC